MTCGPLHFPLLKHTYLATLECVQPRAKAAQCSGATNGDQGVLLCLVPQSAPKRCHCCVLGVGGELRLPVLVVVEGWKGSVQLAAMSLASLSW
jgi:hypothetical protein